MITSRTINIATLTIEDKEDFKRNLAYTIDCCFCEEMQKRSDGKLTYTGVQTILARVRTFFKEQLNTIPPEIERCCLLSEALAAPGEMAKIELLKAAVGIGGGTSGVVAILAAIGSILGWGQSAWAAVVIFFTGASLTLPLIAAGGGAILVAMSMYFMLSGSDAQRSEKFLKALKNGCCAAVDDMWNKHGAKLAA